MFKELLENNSTITNTKGGLYYNTTYNANLDLFILANRSKYNCDLELLFINAYNEDKLMATLNILHFLDIRGGKGERKVFKCLFHKLCLTDIELAKKVLASIPTLGRYDYILEAYQTELWDDVVDMIKTQLDADMLPNAPSLLAKWLPSVRTHNKNNPLAIKLAKDLGLEIKEYRKTLTCLRNKINIVEHQITNKDYASIDYEKVPSLAMNQYYSLFAKYDETRFFDYLAKVKEGKKKINASVLEPYQIIKKALGFNPESKVIDELWRSQKDVLNGDATNALVIADTSGSMWDYNMLPITTALGLAIYLAERNKGIFHDTFINFSTNPSFQKLTGNTLTEKLGSINYNNWAGTTDIDKALEMILDATLKSPEDECPSHLIIISDMEFDCSVSGKTNYHHWQDEYAKHNLKMPKIIFWCVSPALGGIPVTKNEKDVCVISGFTPKIFSNILNIDTYSPIDVMVEILEKYLPYLK